VIVHERPQHYHSNVHNPKTNYADMKDTHTITVMFDNPKTDYTNMKDTNTITVMFDNPKTDYTNMKDTNTVYCDSVGVFHVRVISFRIVNITVVVLVSFMFV
jgi:hypothetical protein